MKLSLTIAALVATASARQPASVFKRHYSGLATFLKDDTIAPMASMACKDIIFIFARGSTEPKPLGIIVGPGVCNGLKSKFVGRVDCVGVAKKYTASMKDNGQRQFTSQEAIDDAISEFKEAASRCPSSKIVFGGYSQGGAVMHGAVAKLDEVTKSKLVAGVMFGDSMNGKHSGKIQNYPADRVLQVCHDGDGICAARLSGITAAHLNYASADYAKAVNFMASKINSTPSGGGFGGKGKGGKRGATEK